MGAFFTSIQVFAGEAGAETRAALLAAIRRQLKRQWVECAAEEAERSLAVGPPGRWVGVYDEDTEDQDPRKIRRLAERLSAAVDGYAAGILVHDSDILWLVLCHRGRKIDEYDSNPEYLGKRPPARRRKALAGQPELWARLLVAGASPVRLREVWERRPRFAEETVAAMAPLLGWDEDLTAVGWESLRELEGTDFTHLHFAPRGGAAARKATGDPSFQVVSSVPDNETGFDEPLWLGFAVWNQGGATRGLTVEASGAFFEGGLARLDLVEVRPATGAIELGGAWVERPDGTRRFEATFPDVVIGAGGGRPGPDGRHRGMFLVGLRGQPLRAGRGDVHVSVRPVAAADGAGECRIDVAVVPPARRPLRCADVPASERLLRDLAREDVLVGLGVLDPAWRAEPDLLAGGLRGWEEDVLRGAGSIAVMLLDRPGAPGGARQVASAALASDAAWSSALAQLSELGGLSVISLDLPGSPADALTWRRAGETGCTLAHGWPGWERPDNLATVAFWAEVRSLGPDGLTRAQQRVRGTFDTLLERGLLVQAFLTRTGSGPGPHALHNLYEHVCGILGAFVFRPEWCSRWLRGIGDVVWLGPALAARVDPAQLEAAALVRRLGGGLGIERRPGASLDELERALAPLLPGRADATPFAASEGAPPSTRPSR